MHFTINNLYSLSTNFKLFTAIPKNLYPEVLGYSQSFQQLFCEWKLFLALYSYLACAWHWIDYFIAKRSPRRDMSLDDEGSQPSYNFSWIVQNELAGMGWPRTVENLNFLVQQGIRHLVTLSPEMIPPVKNYTHLQWTLIPVEEFEAPSMEDINKFIAICEDSRKRNEVNVCRNYAVRVYVLVCLAGVQNLRGIATDVSLKSWS